MAETKVAMRAEVRAGVMMGETMVVSREEAKVVAKEEMTVVARAVVKVVVG